MIENDGPYDTRRTWSDCKTAVYRHFDADGRLLYVGCSSDPHGRFVNHKCKSAWAFQVATISIEWFENRATALAAERAAILTEKPPFNSALGGKQGKAWSDNLGHIYVSQWLKSSGVTIKEFADRLGVRVGEARLLATEVRHIRIPKQLNLCIASDGYVPQKAWDRLYTKNAAQRGRTPAMLTAEEAAKEVSICLEHIRKWGKHASPYTQLLLNNPPATQEGGHV